MVLDLKEAAKESRSYRKVIFTGPHSQLVLMSLATGTEIGSETHPVDQFFYVIDGDGVATLAGRTYPIEKSDAVCVPAGVEHNFACSDDEPLKLFTIYSPPQHPAGLEQTHKPEPVAALIL